MFEVELAQGAKPGKGGMLLKEKITSEIAEIRKVPMGRDALSPPRHAEFDDVVGLFEFLDHVRDVTDKPVGIKLMSETGQLSRSCGYTSPDQLQSNDVLVQAEPGRRVPLSGVVTSD
ncbi:MAG: hypothetical protein JJE10_02450 [Thermoleophilia bacterium]|nr:hypothetical protein [Thermoleophilia bacterium]